MYNRCEICGGRLWGIQEYSGDFFCPGHTYPSNSATPLPTSCPQCAEKDIAINNLMQARHELQSQLTQKEETIKKLEDMLDKLSNGEAMNVVRESEGVYSVIFKNQSPKQ